MLPREPTVKTTIRLPESVYYELRVLVADPRSGRIRYDTWGELFTRLARRHLDECKVATIAADEDTIE